MIKGAIKSDKGFYVGDICYALAEDVYHGVWGGAGYEDGKHTDPATGRDFIVAGTADGDGEYNDQTGRLYPVDAGNIGIVPLELLDKGEFAALQASRQHNRGYRIRGSIREYKRHRKILVKGGTAMDEKLQNRRRH